MNCRRLPIKRLVIMNWNENNMVLITYVISKTCVCENMLMYLKSGTIGFASQSFKVRFQYLVLWVVAGCSSPWPFHSHPVGRCASQMKETTNAPDDVHALVATHDEALAVLDQLSHIHLEVVGLLLLHWWKLAYCTGTNPSHKFYRLNQVGPEITNESHANEIEPYNYINNTYILRWKKQFH